jgi:predicted NAD/FAD-dependent oxidoreductase
MATRCSRTGKIVRAELAEPIPWRHLCQELHRQPLGMPESGRHIQTREFYMTARIAIVGAGMAGASCAWHLRQAGLEVDVFDKSPDVGGRMAARAMPMHSAGQALAGNIDHGAQYFTARDAEFRAFVQSQLGEGGSIAAWQPRIEAAKDNPLLKSSLSEPWYVGAPSMPAAIRQLLVGTSVFTHAQILHLEQDVDGWTLEAAEGPNEHTHYSGYAAVAVAMPGALARRLVKPHSETLAKACQQVAMTPCWSALFVTEALPDAADIYLDDTQGLSWVGRDSSKPGRQIEPGVDTWVVHADAAWSSEHLEVEPGVAAHALEAAFVAAMRAHGQRVHVISSAAHRWRHARAATVKRAPVSCDEGLALCGDYLREGRVEAAFISGREAARQLLETI